MRGCPRSLGPEKISREPGEGTPLLGASRTVQPHPSVSLDPKAPESLGAAEAQKSWQRGGEPWSGVLLSSELLFRSPPPTLLCHGVRRRVGSPQVPWLVSSVPRSALPTKAADHVPPPRHGLGVGRRATPGSRSNPSWIPTRRCASGGRRAAPRSPEAPGSASPTSSRSRCSALKAALGGALATGLVDCIKTMHPTAIP